MMSEKSFHVGEIVVTGVLRRAAFLDELGDEGIVVLQDAKLVEERRVEQLARAHLVPVVVEPADGAGGDNHRRVPQGHSGELLGHEPGEAACEKGDTREVVEGEDEREHGGHVRHLMPDDHLCEPLDRPTNAGGPP